MDAFSGQILYIWVINRDHETEKYWDRTLFGVSDGLRRRATTTETGTIVAAGREIPNLFELFDHRSGRFGTAGVGYAAEFLCRRQRGFSAVAGFSDAAFLRS